MRTNKTLAEVLEQSRRIWHKGIARTIRAARAADPATGGNDLLCHNWGNAASRAVWSQFWASWRKVDAAAGRMAKEAEHREHAAKNWFPLWCQQCEKVRAAARGPKCGRVA